MVVFGLAMMVALGGVLLEMGIGSRFIFFHSADYKAGAWWAFWLLFPLIGWGMLQPSWQSQMRFSFPTGWIRWLLVLPLSAAVCAAMFVIAPLGWVAAHAWALGVLAQAQPGRLLSVDDYRHSVRACDQKAVLAVQGHSASICLEGIAAIPMTGNRPVTVLAKQSAWGLLVVGIQAQ